MDIYKLMLPHSDGLRALALLGEDVEVLEPPGMFGGRVSVILRGNGKAVRMTATYEEVVFKFECFGINVDEAKSFDDHSARLIGRLKGQLHCLFRSEWELSALPGDVPPGWEPILRRRGSIHGQPVEALNGCLSMVGIGAWSAGRPTTLLILSDDVPATFDVLGEEQAMAGLSAECDVVDVALANEWVTARAAEQ